MKNFFAAILIVFLLNPIPSTAQDPVQRKRDQIYVEFITDCNWFVENSRGDLKLKASKTNRISFRAWQPYLKYGTIDLYGFVMWTQKWLWTRDYVISWNSAYKANFGTPPGIPTVGWAWTYVIHFNELSGRGIPNAGTHMRVWGPCKNITLYHGEAMITHGDQTFYIKVDEKDYANFPPWRIELK
jgi:hypothetical protein